MLTGTLGLHGDDEPFKPATSILNKNVSRSAYGKRLGARDGSVAPQCVCAGACLPISPTMWLMMYGMQV